MVYIKQFGIILGVTFAAEIVRYCVPLPVPASIYGLLLMLFLLKTGAVKLDQVKDAAYFLVGILQLIFIPATVGLLVSYVEFRDILPQSVAVILFSSAIVIAVTGRAAQGVHNAAIRNKNS